MQRHLGVGYNVAARVLENLEQAGVVSAMDAYGKRTALNAQPESPVQAEQPSAAPAVAPVSTATFASAPAPQLSDRAAAFLASREWPNQAARNSARAVLIEFERFCAQQTKVAA